jgi:hypothetical protein
MSERSAIQGLFPTSWISPGGYRVVSSCSTFYILAELGTAGLLPIMWLQVRVE